MPGDQPISEDELHAYVDGDMASGRRLDIALYLARHPAEAARMEVFRAQREAIHALFDDFALEPVPRRLRSIVRRHAQRRARRRSAGMAVAITVATVVLVTGRTVVHYAAPEHGGWAAEAAAQRAPAADELPVIRPWAPLGQRNRNFDI